MAYSDSRGGGSPRPSGGFSGGQANRPPRTGGARARHEEEQASNERMADPAYRAQFKEFFDFAPEPGEFVIATVKKIMPYGAFCTLEEYNEREAFIHVSEVASRWIKNIHEFLKEGQKIVARVHKLVPEKNQIDLSLKRVTDNDRKVKMEAYKREKRASKLFEMCAKKLNEDPAEALASLGDELIKKHGDLPTAWESISFTGDKALKGIKISPAWKKILIDTAQQNIKKPEVRISGEFTITSQAPDAIDHIKTALKNALKAADGREMEIIYIGAPKYHILIKAEDYKTAEKILLTACSEVESAMKGIGTVEFKRAET